MIVIELAQAMLDLAARIELAGQCEYVQVTARCLWVELISDDVTPKDAPAGMTRRQRMGDRSKLAQAIGRDNIGLCHAVLKACEGETLPANAAHNLRGAAQLLAPELRPAPDEAVSPEQPADDLLTVTEAAELAGVDTDDISGACRGTILKTNGKTGLDRRITPRSLEEWMNIRTAKKLRKNGKAKPAPKPVTARPIMATVLCEECDAVVSLKKDGTGECPKCHNHKFKPLSSQRNSCATPRK